MSVGPIQQLTVRHRSVSDVADPMTSQRLRVLPRPTHLLHPSVRRRWLHIGRNCHLTNVILWPRFHGATVCLNNHLFAHSPSQPSMWNTILDMECALMDDASSWRLWVPRHNIITFIVIHTSILRWFLDNSFFISILPHGHIFIISHNRCAISWTCSFSIFARRKIQITSARQVKPLRTLLHVTVFVAKHCLDAALGHSRNTQEKGVCDACRPEFKHDFLTILSSTDALVSRNLSLSFRLLSASNTAHVFGGSTVRQDFCPIELLLGWV